MKAPLINSTLQPASLGKQNQPIQQPQSQQPDLNFIMALSLVTIERPQLFLKQQALVEFLCTNLLFTSKLQQDKAAASKTKTLPLRTPLASSVAQQQNSTSIQPTICNIIHFLYENESSWPDIFVKAYVDDSLGERSWIDNPQCKEFTDNIKTAFQTKSIPYSADTVSSTTGSTPTQTLNLNELQQKIINNQEDSNSNSSFNTTTQILTDKQTTNRYDSIKNDIDQMIIELVKNQLNSSNMKISQLTASQRISTQSNILTNTLSCDNKNFLKLLQSVCGISEVRSMAIQRMEIWLSNPKLITHAQDLLMSICVNCDKGDYSERDLIAQIIKLKPKLKQQPHYYDCIKELIKLNIANFEALIQMVVVNELIHQQQQQLNSAQQQQQPQSQLIAQSRNQHNLNLLQTAFSTDGALASKILAQTMQKILLQRMGDDFIKLLRILLRDTVRNSRQDFDLIKYTRELINEHLIKQYFFNNNQNHLQTIDLTIFGLAGGLADFNQLVVRERYVNNICDLITVCILIAITPQIKEAYLSKQAEKKETLIKYYMLMTQVQCDTVTWLQEIHRIYQLNPTELVVNYLSKILFMVDKPDQCYTIDNWPSEQERATLLRVVSEIPVLSETLNQVLIITQNIPEQLHFYMLHLEENLLKSAALVYRKDIYSIKFTKIDQFVQSLFSICMYRCQQIASNLAVQVLYWRAMEILLIVSALDPKGFGLTAWEQYPTLRIMMEMIMTDDYNFPPQSSLTDEMTLDRFRSIETQINQLEKQDILEFEYNFSIKQGNPIRFTEMNSTLITILMKFDPNGPPRRPPNDLINNIRKLNAEYNLGQLLCKSRQPDFLLSLIKRQNSKLSLPWLSSLIESNSSDSLEIIPIQCICEFIWNVLNGQNEDMTLKKQMNLDKLMILVNKIKAILTSSDLTDSIMIQQIKDVFDYFLNKLCSDKSNIRYAGLKLLRRLLITNCQLDKQYLQPPVMQIDLNELIETIKKLSAFEIYLKPLLIKHFRRVIMVETKPDYINLYLMFLFEQLVNDYQTQIELESSIKMDFESCDTSSNNDNNGSIKVKDESFRNLYNEIAIDLADFFFQRSYYINTVTLIKYTNWDSLYKMRNSIDKLHEIKKLIKFIMRFSILILNLNEYTVDCTFNDEKSSKLTAPNIKILLKNKQPFDRSNLEINSYLLIELPSEKSNYLYINEKTFNLILYLFTIVIQISNSFTQLAKLSVEHHSEIHFDYEEDDILSEKFYQTDLNNMIDQFYSKESDSYRFQYLNCRFDQALNQLVRDKLLRFNLNFTLNSFSKENIKKQMNFFVNKYENENEIREHLAYKLTKLLIDSMDNNLLNLFDCLFNKCGLTPLSVCLLTDKLEKYIQSNKYSAEQFETNLNSVLISNGITIAYACQIAESFFSKINTHAENKEKLSGSKLIEVLKNIRSKKIAINGTSNKISNNDIEMMDVDTAKLELFSFGDKNNQNNPEPVSTSKENNAKPSVDYLDQIRKNIENIKNNIKINQNEVELKEEIELIETVDDQMTAAGSELMKIIQRSTKQNLESNLNKKLNELNEKDRIVALLESILIYENKSSTNNRCIIDLLLDYFCHIDPQIIDKQFDLEKRLLFESRKTIKTNNTKKSETISMTDITQSFLLSLFIHQANWQKLFECVQNLLDKHQFFESNLNPAIMLDFMSSLIHIPEFWKGTESRVLEKYNEENVLNLNENQICCLIDMIIEETCISYEKNRIKPNDHLILDHNENLVKDYEDMDLVELKFKMNKRIQLLKHFFKNYFHLKKEKLFEKIVQHLNQQKLKLTKINIFESENIENKKIIFNKIQTLFLYCVYLEENLLIHFVINSNRMFSNIFYQIDKPTQLDLKAHNLLNCFGEIEVNYSNNLTSSGIIGVSNVVTHYKKQEKQELIQFNKKQELFMSDANLVCIKLASTHPFIFIRYLIHLLFLFKNL